jgi:superfamily II DNA/RNA helicase
MFSVEELASCRKDSWFNFGYQQLERAVLLARLGSKPLDVLQSKNIAELSRFAHAVIASAPSWKAPSEGEARELCLVAADAENGLGNLKVFGGDASGAHQHFWRASLLYDICGMPGAAATVSKKNGLDVRLKDYFSRERLSLWGSLSDSPEALAFKTSRGVGSAMPESEGALLERALAEVVAEYGQHLQREDPTKGSADAVISALQAYAGMHAHEINSDDVAAMSKSLEIRRGNATLRLLANNSALSAGAARSIGMPLELWPVQRRALESGLLNQKVKSFGLAAPTGTGKTSLTQALIAATLEADRTRKVVYLSPSRALVHQISSDLLKALTPSGIVVRELGAHLTMHQQMDGDFDGADVIVFTPERADLLMRVDPEFVSSIGLVIVDEAHHIEQGTRGILLEFYLWRIRQLISNSARIVQLSAVAPNITELVEWLDSTDSSVAVKVDWRANRLRLGTFERTKDGTAAVKFEGMAPFVLFEAGTFPAERTKGIAALAERLANSGVVLVLCMTVSLAEEIANEIGKLRGASAPRASSDDTNGIVERLDAKIERELFPESPLRELLSKRVAFHHAQLPPNVRIALEEAITGRQVDIVCATTTLAEGVNFPFSTVVVESLVAKDHQLTPRSLWNIAGRAGRFGVDSEGHCIIFEPSHFEGRLKGFTLRDYLGTRLDDIPPVQSALATALTELNGAIQSEEIDSSDLDSVSLDGIAIDGKPGSKKSKRLRGLVNLVRVGYAHASASNLISLHDERASELSTHMLASRQISEEVRVFAEKFSMQQRVVIRGAFASDAELMKIAARIGWSLETQQVLYSWISGLADWQIERFGRVVLGGRVTDGSQLGYLLGPVSKHMGEFEGEKLGGFTAFVARSWIEGLPLTEIREAQKEKDLGKLVKIIYSRVQYLLPWALFGVHELMEFEAKRRHVNFLNGIHDLSALSAEGVPNFDALTLIKVLGVERVDATRISGSYRARGSSRTTIIGHIRSLEWNQLVGIVRGADRRRIDPDLRSKWEYTREMDFS